MNVLPKMRICSKISLFNAWKQQEAPHSSPASTAQKHVVSCDGIQARLFEDGIRKAEEIRQDQTRICQHRNASVLHLCLSTPGEILREELTEIQWILGYNF